MIAIVRLFNLAFIWVNQLMIVRRVLFLFLSSSYRTQFLCCIGESSIFLGLMSTFWFLGEFLPWAINDDPISVPDNVKKNRLRGAD